MSDIELFVFLVAITALAIYIMSGLEKESLGRDILGSREPAKTPEALIGLRLVLGGHLVNFTLCLPLLWYSPFLLDYGHSMGIWLNGYLNAWMKWLALTQCLYLIPCYLYLKKQERSMALKGLRLGGAITLAVCAAFWSIVILQQDRAMISLQAAAGMLLFFSCIALFWLTRETRLALRS